MDRFRGAVRAAGRLAVTVCLPPWDALPEAPGVPIRALRALRRTARTHRPKPENGSLTPSMKYICHGLAEGARGWGTHMPAAVPTLKAGPAARRLWKARGAETGS